MKKGFYWYCGWVIIFPFRVIIIVLIAPILASCPDCFENIFNAHDKQEDSK
jgi:hypothetical protein